MGVIFQMACNRTEQPCGCAEWDELIAGAWVRKHSLCLRHEAATTEGGDPVGC